MPALNKLNNQIVEYASLLFCDRANGVAAVTAAPIVPAAVADVEVEAARVVAAAIVQRSRPVVAARATAAEVRTVAAARSGKEDAITVRTDDELTVHTI